MLFQNFNVSNSHSDECERARAHTFGCHQEEGSKQANRHCKSTNQRNFFHSSDDIISYSCTLCSVQENCNDGKNRIDPEWTNAIQEITRPDRKILPLDLSKTLLCFIPTLTSRTLRQKWQRETDAHCLQARFRVSRPFRQQLLTSVSTSLRSCMCTNFLGFSLLAHPAARHSPVIEPCRHIQIQYWSIKLNY